MRASPMLSAAVIVAVVTLSGCGSKNTDEKNANPRIAEVLDPTTEVTTVASLREKLKLNEGEGHIDEKQGKITLIDLSRTRVTDLSPLKGLPLKRLYLNQTRVSDLSPLKGNSLVLLDLTGTSVSDLSPLKGLSLEELYLNKTKVADLSPLDGMPLKLLNLLETRVTDISVVKTLNLNMLWLNDTKVKDLSPLKKLSLESLDITGTPVTDLSAISGMKSLERLNLERCAVTDLTPLKDLNLKRITFQPSKITKGLDVIRGMESLKHMHTRFQTTREGWLEPGAFWAAHAAGTLPK